MFCFGVHLFLVLLLPFSVYISHIHTSVTSLMQLREGKAVARKPKDWSGGFPTPIPHSEPPVTTTACFLRSLLGQNFLILLLVTFHHKPSRLFSRILRRFDLVPSSFYFTCTKILSADIMRAGKLHTITVYKI